MTQIPITSTAYGSSGPSQDFCKYSMRPRVSGSSGRLSSWISNITSVLNHFNSGSFSSFSNKSHWRCRHSVGFLERGLRHIWPNLHLHATFPTFLSFPSPLLQRLFFCLLKLGAIDILGIGVGGSVCGCSPTTSTYWNTVFFPIRTLLFHGGL